MLDSKVVELTDGLIQTQFAERRLRLQEELRSASQEFNARNTLFSSMHVLRVAEVCRREVETRAWIVHHAHLRVLSQLAVDPYPELSRDLKGRLSYFLPLGDDYAQALQDLARRSGLQSHPEFRIHEAREHILAKIGTEIDLFVETLARRKKQQGNQADGRSVYNFYAGVGAFQAGPGSTANVVQHLGTQDKETLLQALSLVKDALSKLPETAGFPKAEIVEMVEDADAEIKKPSPNGIKLSSVLTTIGNSIQTLGSLQSVYQTLKAALLPFGIMLP